ncbi:MAG: universal stress protein [Lentisphaerae bacterium]|nr:universal stress protein [Lentisphaerota bacterium]
MIFGRANATPPERPATAANLLGSLLLVVDGSEPSMAAARFAMDLAKQLQSHVTAVYVVDTATMDYLTQMRIFVAEERAEFEADIERTGQRYLEYVSTIGRKQGVETKTLLRKGRFHTVILQEARSLAVNAIVLGGWRRSATRKDATSVERQLVLDLAGLPVIVVKSDSDRETEGDD